MFLLWLTVMSSPSAHALSLPLSWSGILKEAEKSGAQQLVLSIASGPKATRVAVFCLEFANGSWQMALRPMSGSVGRNGVADPEKKCEGDGCSPYGIFKLGTAFGYEPAFATRMPYRQVEQGDIWVDDPAADDYNRLTRIEATKAKSFEYMRRNDDLYEAGLVVEFNTTPVQPGHGSAIFVHYWGKPFRPTAGCLGLPKKNLAAILKFLDPEKKPAIAFVRKDLLKN